MFANLVQLRPHVWANPADRTFRERAIRLGGYVPATDLERARIYVEAGRTVEAKAIYRRLLAARENVHVHRLLASLCTYPEAVEMLERYRDYPGTAEWYRRRVREFETEQGVMDNGSRRR